MNITVKYSCPACGLHRRCVDVPARKGNEDVKHWMLKTMSESIGRDHATVSPTCQSLTMSEVMIPISGVEHIGGPAVN